MPIYLPLGYAAAIASFKRKSRADLTVRNEIPPDIICPNMVVTWIHPPMILAVRVLLITMERMVDTLLFYTTVEAPEMICFKISTMLTMRSYELSPWILIKAKIYHIRIEKICYYRRIAFWSTTSEEFPKTILQTLE